MDPRITIVIAGLGGGGAERVCVNLANAWAADGRATTLLTISQKATPAAYAVDRRVERRDVGWPRAPRAGEEWPPILASLERTGCPELAGELPKLSAIRAAVAATDPDVVVSHMDITNVRVLASTLDLAVPVIACEHTDSSRVGLGAWGGARLRLYPRAAAVVVPHPISAEWFGRRGIVARAIANPLVPPAGQAEACPHKLPRRRLITLGRLAPEKRIGMIVGAFARIAGDFPLWDLEIYGDGPQHEELARVVLERSLQPRVRLRGFTNDPYGALAGADLYVSASAVEGFGNSIWEALACGVPVVAMECGVPAATLVRDGLDGRIVHGGEEELAGALSVLMRDEGMRSSFAAHAPEATARFPIAQSLRAWDDLLAELSLAVRA